MNTGPIRINIQMVIDNGESFAKYKDLAEVYLKSVDVEDLMLYIYNKQKELSCLKEAE